MGGTVLVGVAAGLVLAVMGIARAYNFFSNAAAADEKDATFVANPNNGTTLRVRGWTRSQLDRISSDFWKSYEPHKVPVNLNEIVASVFELTFPQDIRPIYLMFLVNYLQYPEGFDPDDGTIAVRARVVLTEAFGAPGSSFLGKYAAIYIPEDDTEYDLVYAQIDGGSAFRVPFTTLKWEPVEDARMAQAVRSL